MANSAGSRKRARQAVKRNKHNSQIRAKVRTFIKKVTYAIDAGNKKEATSGFADMQKNLYQAVSKDRKSTRLNSSHSSVSRMPSSA